MKQRSPSQAQQSNKKRDKVLWRALNKGKLSKSRKSKATLSSQKLTKQASVEQMSGK